MSEPRPLYDFEGMVGERREKPLIGITMGEPAGIQVPHQHRAGRRSVVTVDEIED